MKKLYKLLLICLLIIAGGGNALKAQSYNSDNSETANRAETPTYISKIAVAYGAEASTPKGILKDNGFTIIDKDLNAGCGGNTHYIYMGYKTTTNPANAITGIYIREGNDTPNSATFDGVTAYLLGGSTEDNPGENKPVDLNIDAGGATLHVYVSRNTNLAAITDIKFSNTNSMSGYVTQNIDLNKGASGEYIYLHYKQFSGKASATFHYLNSSGSRTSSTTSVSVKHHQQAVNNTPSAPTSISYDGKTFALIGWREDNTATTAGSTPSYTYMDSKVYRAVYSANVSLIYNANGGSGAPSTQNATQYINAGSSSIAKSNASITIPATIPTHDATKCNFSGWSSSSSATTAQYQPGNNISINTNTTLYAVWPEHNGTKTYVNNGNNHTYTWSCCGKTVTEDHIYDNGIDHYCGAHIHEIDGNGYCHLCDGYPAELVNGYYEIYNADNLFWFAEYVNTIDRTASAKLMNDIDLENRPWTPIGTTGESSHNFRGHFDGNGKTITGLNVEVTRSGGGFFGEVRLGTVEDFTIYGEVELNGKYDYVGGVIGSAPGFNSNQPDHNGATIRNITSYVNVTLGEGSHGSNRVAGFIGYANHETLIENCTWYGTLDLGPYRAQDGVGGLVGKANDNSEITIRNCAAYGTIKTSYKSNSYNNSNTIFIGGIVSNSVSSAQTTLENCIWAGTLVNNTDLGSNAHISAIGTLNGSKSVTNCYALNNMPYVTTHNAHNTGITTVTAEQLASGEIAYKLQGTQTTHVWGQNIDNGETKDTKPILGGAKVYEYNFDSEKKYSNTNITAGGQCGDNLYWKVIDNSLTIYGTGAMYDYEWHENEGDISPWRNLNTAPKSLVLEEGITYIGDYAFYNCKGFKGSLTIPNSVTNIGDRAFSSCSGFTGSLTIPNSVTSIGNSAFYYCSGFTGSLTIPNSVTSIGSYAFYNCKGFNGSLTIPNSVTNIGDYAFQNCSGFNGSLTIGNIVTSIGREAFYGCSGFTEVYSLAETAPTLGTNAFKYINGNATLYYLTSSEQSYNDKGWFNYFPQHIGLFDGKCGDNLYWVVNDNVLTISGTGAMYDYDNIDNKAPWRSLNPAPTSLVLEKGITHIGNVAFYGCEGFTEVHSAAVIAPTLGTDAFANINENATLYYPALSKQSYEEKGWFNYFPQHIGSDGKCGDNLYWYVDDENILTVFGTGAMYDYESSGDNISPWRKLETAPTSLVLEEGITHIGNYAFDDCSGFKGSLTIPNSVTTIGHYAFQYCSGFTGSLTIPNSVTSIGEASFSGCSSFTGSLTIGNSVKTIGNSAFRGCEGFNGSLTIPNSVMSIGDYAFYFCEGFKGSLTIPNSVTSIGNYAFALCRSFTGSLTIPNSVTTIGDRAFYYCSGLTNIFFYRDTNPTIGTGAFSNINAKVCAPVIWESFDNIPEDKLVKMATYTSQQDNETTSQQVWVFPEGMTEVGEDDHVAINAPMVLGSLQDYKTTRLQGSEANSLWVKSFGYCGNGTTVNGSITIEDGAQLYCEIANGEVTVKKDIIGYAETTRLQDNETTSETVWYTIASPLKDTLLISDSQFLNSSVPQFLSSNSDLYRYDEPSYTWQNAKNSANNGFNTIDPGRGYLYANAENTSLEFTGMINTDDVTYNLTAKSNVLNGFHLVGNPFTHDIYLGEAITESQRIIFEFNDEYGDGWNGNALNLSFSNGTPDKIITIESGNSKTETINVASGVTVTVSFTIGNYPEECSFTIKYDDETVICDEYSSEGSLTNVEDGATLTTFTVKEGIDVLVNGYYTLTGEGAWAAEASTTEAIKPMQSILVKSLVDDYELHIFNISRQQSAISRQRSGRGQQDNRTTRQQVLEMSVSNAQHSDRAFVVFDKGVGLDKINHENENIPLLYIPMNDTDYAIAMMDINVNEIPVNFETNVMGEYTISLRQENCEFDELYLLDKQTGEKVNILENDYTFIATSNDAPERFVLLKDNGQQTTDNSHFAYINNGDIVVFDIEGKADISIFDAMGRCLYKGSSSDETARIANDFSAGVYVIQKADDNGVKVQKLMID